MVGTLNTGISHVASAVVRCGSKATCDTGLPEVNATPANLQHGLETIFAVVGVIAVIAVVIGGLQFVLAQGDPQGTARARQTIIYAAVGLMIAVSAEAIVAFVLNKIK